MLHRRRRFRLIRPRLQLRLIGAFFGVSALSLVLQYLVFVRVLAAAAQRLPTDGELLMPALHGDLLFVLALSFGLLAPATFVIGVLVTHRVAGPVYRFETWLKQVLAGETRADCRLRQGDELTELCELLNRATATVRAEAHESESPRRAA
jgi:hypothetical protein